MELTGEPNFEERSKEIGIDSAAYELMAWQDEQVRRAALGDTLRGEVDKR